MKLKLQKKQIKSLSQKNINDGKALTPNAVGGLGNTHQTDGNICQNLSLAPKTCGYVE
ncbi:hypothetical protein [Pseudoalteromonas luteoviolacea]|uniref:Uncharacterized protein n=1 Tax=Pseudoalteromonas luteoviolacea S4060-1 TaxID=1365257 RepID=A0A162CGZ2_9GAMM|nr:hypothetical protein [Pseudoalteromonas luteoviolacea]KZN28987.1 hypothetical protein N480_09470 [Pseudoalteromonas luteoviolacea S2607]KZN67778.1 hypothetical protein N478_16280 [Pseudoalteromonas luteoviolacea S4060-1]